MKLNEVKIALIGQFFSKQTAGLSQDAVEPIFLKLGEELKVDLSRLSTSDPLVETESSNSSDPSKAFKRFTDGRRAVLTINEDDGMKKLAIFAATRSGRQVSYVDLTVNPQVAKMGDLAAVKQALRQAKNLNDDVYYTIRSEE